MNGHAAQKHEPNDKSKTKVAYIRRVVEMMHEPGSVVELRCLKTRWGTVSGYFNNSGKLAEIATELSGTVPAVYITLNPVNPDLLARASNRVERHATTTSSDNDVIKRRWLPIDFDPVRPSNISSTDAEKDLALERAKDCREWLSSLRVPAAIFADSGNGAHLLYRIDLPNDAASMELIKKCLEALSARFTDDKVSIDLKNFNAGRIWKVYGTLASKGDSMPDRPHRLATILEVGSTEPLSVELLKRLAAKAPESQKHQSRTNGQHQSFDLDDFIRRNGIAVKRESEWNGGRRWILEVCPWNPEHNRGEAFVVQFASGAISAGCQHNSCAGHNWHELRELYEPKAHAKNHTYPKSEPGKPHMSPPLTLQGEALYGLAGDFVRTILPYTEADPVALLVYLLTCFGNCIGHNPYWSMEKTRHFLNLFVVLVGDTSRGRKGTSRSTPDYVFDHVDRDWRRESFRSGMSSGQGLIWHVRDPIIGKQPVKKDGKVVDYEQVILDEGARDKRLCVVEEEFSSVLKMTSMEGSVLSSVIREAWDSGNLMTLVSGRKAPVVKATDAHISIVGHVTKQELLRHLDSTEQANGFANRFLWFSVQRSKFIANPTGAPDEMLEPITERLIKAKDFAIKTSEIQRNHDTAEVWKAVYPKLTEDAPGLLGAITSRAAPQVMRLASLYALLDLSVTIRPEHLKAALALWDYSFSSARFIFGESLGDPIADKILNAIKVSEAGLSRTDIAQLFSNHNSAAIDSALAYLLKIGAVVESIIQTGGRPKTVYQKQHKEKEI